MKTLMKTTLAAALLSTALFANAAEAQQKIGVVSFQAILQNLPQTREIEETIQNEFKTRIEEVQAIETQMNGIAEKQQRDAAILSASERTAMQREFEGLESQLQLKVRALREDMNRRGTEERDKIMMEIARATQAVATELGYDLVIQASAVAHMTPDHELSEEVIAEMTGGN